MDATAQPSEEVGPLELFFDLVFVFAVSQLSSHLLSIPTWRGAAETGVLLIAVFSIWAATSWSASLPGMGRKAEAIAIIAVMPLGLFMNAAIGDAFGGRPWAFLIPFLVSQLGIALGMLAMASNALMLEHFTVQFVWLLATAVLWVAGAVQPPEHRLYWWAAAAVIDLIGSWTAHRLPWRRLQTRAVEIAPQHMVERSRLLLIIALGEAILATGTAISHVEPSVPSYAAGALALACVALLWAIYFAGSDRLVNERASTADDPLALARIAINSQVINLASLIAIAGATELAISEPRAAATPTLSLLLFGGLWLFIATQMWYLHKLSGHYSTSRLAALCALPVIGLLTRGMPAWVVLAAGVSVVGALCLAMLTTARRAAPAPAA